jgi:hypothetical protein
MLVESDCFHYVVALVILPLTCTDDIVVTCRVLCKAPGGFLSKRSQASSEASVSTFSSAGYR